MYERQSLQNVQQELKFYSQTYWMTLKFYSRTYWMTLNKPSPLWALVSEPRPRVPSLGSSEGLQESHETLRLHPPLCLLMPFSRFSSHRFHPILKEIWDSSEVRKLEPDAHEVPHPIQVWQFMSLETLVQHVLATGTETHFARPERDYHRWGNWILEEWGQVPDVRSWQRLCKPTRAPVRGVITESRVISSLDFKIRVGWSIENPEKKSCFVNRNHLIKKKKTGFGL